MCDSTNPAELKQYADITVQRKMNLLLDESNYLSLSELGERFLDENS